MKIAIPVDKEGMEGAVCASFGRAPFFFLYETETKEWSVVENSGLASPGGAGIKAAQIVVDSKAKALLTPRCGENAAQVLESAGITLHKTSSTSVEESIESFVQGKLPLLKDIHPGLSGHGRD
ncbi:MAG TPA: NifB/NifX family molybdenum-iron cluster-binding protein [Limnochordia bacterium]|jgi:predicted Fe-Mo cluster-binding NifX family protein|nr:NifB/NifX family molybdenum-iron cluster-binding protein [Limnochordia bacterium]